jgi:hypothetical protein
LPQRAVAFFLQFLISNYDKSTTFWVEFGRGIDGFHYGFVADVHAGIDAAFDGTAACG